MTKFTSAVTLIAAVCFACLGCTSSSSVVQGQDKPAPGPKTKIEAFEAQEGSVVIRGFSKIGEMRGVYGGLVTVQSMEFINAASGKREYGISIDVKETERLERSNRSFIDYEEIDSLLKGIDYIAKTGKAVTKLDNFQADYHTRGDFHLATFTSGNGMMASIESGSIGSTSMFLKLDDLGKFRGFVADAKAKLDSIR